MPSRSSSRRLVGFRTAPCIAMVSASRTIRSCPLVGSTLRETPCRSIPSRDHLRFAERHPGRRSNSWSHPRNCCPKGNSRSRPRCHRPHPDRGTRSHHLPDRPRHRCRQNKSRMRLPSSSPATHRPIPDLGFDRSRLRSRRGHRTHTSIHRSNTPGNPTSAYKSNPGRSAYHPGRRNNPALVPCTSGPTSSMLPPAHMFRLLLVGYPAGRCSSWGSDLNSFRQANNSPPYRCRILVPAATIRSRRSAGIPPDRCC